MVFFLFCMHKMFRIYNIILSVFLLTFVDLLHYMHGGACINSFNKVEKPCNEVDLSIIQGKCSWHPEHGTSIRWNYRDHPNDVAFFINTVLDEFKDVRDGLVDEQPETRSMNAAVQVLARVVDIEFKNSGSFRARPSNMFYKTLLACGRQSLGDANKTSDCLVEQIKALGQTFSKTCASCFGEGAHCGAVHCRLPCMMNSCSKACLECSKSNCTPDILKCTHFKREDLPPPCSDSR